MSKGNLPKCATKNDELAYIFGEFDVVREALVQIASRLRANIFKDKDSGASVGSVVPGSLSFLNMSSGVPTSGFGGRQDLGSPGGMYSLFGLDLQGTTRGKLSSGYGSYGSLQTGEASGYGTLFGYSKSQASITRSSIGVIMNPSRTNVEVTVLNKVVGSILGRDGSNIAHIRGISGEKVKLHDSKLGGSDRIVEIFETPEQMHVAQSLLQAFAMSCQGACLTHGY